MRLKFTIDRLEADRAVLIDDDGTKLVWPKNKLPEGACEGLALNIEILPNKEREIKDKQTAKDLINEIINQA